MSNNSNNNINDSNVQYINVKYVQDKHRKKIKKSMKSKNDSIVKAQLNDLIAKVESNYKALVNQKANISERVGFSVPITIPQLTQPHASQNSAELIQILLGMNTKILQQEASLREFFIRSGGSQIDLDDIIAESQVDVIQSDSEGEGEGEGDGEKDAGSYMDDNSTIATKLRLSLQRQRRIKTICWSSLSEYAW